MTSTSFVVNVRVPKNQPSTMLTPVASWKALNRSSEPSSIHWKAWSTSSNA